MECGLIAHKEESTYLEILVTRKDKEVMDKLCSCGLDRDFQIKLVRCQPCMRKCLVWPFPCKPLAVGSLEPALCLCPQTEMRFTGHRCLLVWSDRVLFTRLQVLCPPHCGVLPGLMTSAFSVPFGSLEINGSTRISSVSSWPLPLPNKEVMVTTGHFK